MNRTKKWKSRRIKKKLQENIRLKKENDLLKTISTIPVPVRVIEMNTQKIAVQRGFSILEEIPKEIIKDMLCHELADYIKPFVEFDCYIERTNPQIVYTATLHVATGDRKYGQ